MDLTEDQIDALKEVTNIAAGKAATALSDMLKTQTLVLMNVERRVFLNIDEFHESGSLSPDALVLGFRAVISKGLLGSVFIVIRFEDLVNLFYDLKYFDVVPPIVKNLEELDENSRSALQEFGNILISQFCSAISDFLHIIMYHEVPEMVIGEYFTLLDGEFAQTSMYSEKVLFLRTDITTKERTIVGEMIYIPYYESYQKILEMLSIDNVIDAPSN
jgi:chemotaxis protein CheC